MMYENEVDVILEGLEDKIKYHKRKIKQLEDRFCDEPAKINTKAVDAHKLKIEQCESAASWMREEYCS